MRLLMQIAGDSLTKVADENWSAAAQSRGELPAFNAALVEEIYKRELAGNSKVPAKLKRIMLLEISQYLENYLWPHFDAGTSSDAHILSILVSTLTPCLVHQLPAQILTHTVEAEHPRGLYLQAFTKAAGERHMFCCRPWSTRSSGRMCQPGRAFRRTWTSSRPSSAAW